MWQAKRLLEAGGMVKRSVEIGRSIPWCCQQIKFKGNLDLGEHYASFAIDDLPWREGNHGCLLDEASAPRSKGRMTTTATPIQENSKLIVSSAEQKIELWLTETTTTRMRLVRFAKGFFYNTAPKRIRIFGLMHWTTKTAVASSAPGLAWYYGTIHGYVAAIASAGIFAANGLVSFFDTLGKERETPSKETQTDMVVRLGDLLASHQVRPNGAAHNRDNAIRACLGILESFARQTTKQKKGNIAVSLLIYPGSSRSRMKIHARNPGNERPVNREVEAHKLLGHRVCELGSAPRIVDDVREFGKALKASPTQSNMTYRSIYFIPLEVTSGPKQGIRGFISIDCVQPYAFYGNRADEIIVNCEPIVSHIKDLL